MTIRKIFGVALVAAVVIVTTQYAVVSVTNLYQYTTQEAINKLIGAGPHEYTMQEGLNLLNTKPGTRDSLVTIFTWVFDDGFDNITDTALFNTIEAYGWDATIAVLGNKALRATRGIGGQDTTHLTGPELQAIQNAGWDLVGHGWNDPGTITSESNPSIWGRATIGGQSDMSRGWADIADYRRDVQQCYAAFDTLGLTPPRGWRYTYGSYHLQYARAIAEVGIEYACGNRGGATWNSRGYDYVQEARNAGGGPGTPNPSNYCSAYPNILPARYHIPQVMADNSTYAEFRRHLLNCIAQKGSWAIFAGHRTDSWLSSGGTDIYQALALVDSLVGDGLLRVVTLTDGYDLFWNTPIGPTANFVYPNFPDHNNDDIIDGMNRYRDAISFGFGHNNWGPDSLGTRDSVFTWLPSRADTSNVDHGVLGYGYVTLSYDTGKKPGVDNSPTGRSLYEWEVSWTLPNFARGKTIRVEYWTQIDMDVVRADHTDYAAPGTADTSMVTFNSFSDNKWNAADYTRQVNIWGGQEMQKNTGDTFNRRGIGSSTNQGAQNVNSNYSTFMPTDTVGGNWQHVSATWHVSTTDDYIIVTITKDSRFPADAVRISNFSVTIDDRFPNRW